MNIVYAPRALHDLESIAAYLGERSPTGAAHVLAAIKAAIDTIAYFPQITSALDEAGHRRLPVMRYPYLVFYRATEDDVIVLHIRHTSRRPPIRQPNLNRGCRAFLDRFSPAISGGPESSQSTSEAHS